MSKINCLDSDFFQKPMSVNFDDDKFGFCALAVFNKKGVFQRTWMISKNIRKKIFQRQRNLLNIYNLDSINEKVYNICEDACPCLDYPEAIMSYFGKTEDTWKSKYVYAVYFNPYLFNTKFDVITYTEQIIGEKHELLDEDLTDIEQDLLSRYDANYLRTASFYLGRKYLIESQAEVKTKIKKDIFFMDGCKPNYDRRRKSQMVLLNAGVRCAEHEMIFYDFLQELRGCMIYNIGCYTDNKSRTTKLCLCQLVIEAKCLYQWIKLSCVLDNCIDKLEDGIVKFNFLNKDYLCKTLDVSLKMFCLAKLFKEYGGRVFRVSLNSHDCIVIPELFAKGALNKNDILRYLKAVPHLSAYGKFGYYFPTLSIIDDRDTLWRINAYNEMFKDQYLFACDNANVFGINLSYDSFASSISVNEVTIL